jgi:predicted transcriptional regulator
MSKKLQHGLSKRERQIMEVIYRKKVATAQEVLDEMPDPPGYSTVRSFLTILEEKGFLKHERRGITVR